MSKYNVPEKYIQIEYTERGLETLCTEARITCTLMPGNSITVTFGEKERKQFEEKLPLYVRNLTHGYSELEMREKYLGEDVAEAIAEERAAEATEFDKKATVVEIKNNPFKMKIRAHGLFKGIVEGKTVAEIHKSGDCPYWVMKQAFEKGAIKLSTNPATLPI